MKLDLYKKQITQAQQINNEKQIGKSQQTCIASYYVSVNQLIAVRLTGMVFEYWVRMCRFYLSSFWKRQYHIYSVTTLLVDNRYRKYIVSTLFWLSFRRLSRPLKISRQPQSDHAVLCYTITTIFLSLHSSTHYTYNLISEAQDYNVNGKPFI